MVAWPEAVTFDDRDRYRALARDTLTWVKTQFGPKLPDFVTPADIRDVDRTGPNFTPLATGRNLDTFGPGDMVADTLDATRHPGNPYRYGGALVGTSAGGSTLTFTNGDVKFFSPPVGSAGMISGLNVCNGDFVIEHAIHVSAAVVLCTGDARFDFNIANSLVVAGGTITGRNLDDHAQRPDVLLRPKEPKLAEFLKLYDSAAEGLHVRADGNSVFVTKADDGKPFAAAGIRSGDRVVKVDGKPVRSVRELNRLLCRAEVGYPGTAAVFLARGEKGVDAAVKLADPPTLDP
ncbi:MAG: PDZ domain-containing protein [Gemmataceae bacterium]|nr:PDZ domain-containing protein [Gemmataceae bacterium]